MPVLKFWDKDGRVKLDKFHLEDISGDNRTSLLDKDSFKKEHFQIRKGIYMAVTDLPFKFSKFFTNTEIHSLILYDGDDKIIVVPSKSYVFWEGSSVEPNHYEFSSDENILRKLLSMKKED
jgi:hypothetical protein